MILTFWERITDNQLFIIGNFINLFEMSSSIHKQDSLKQTFVVPVSADRAFRVFAHEFNSWWPKEYTWSGDSLEKIEIEPGENGRCFERGPHGFECDWGRVLAWAPPHRVAFTWQIGPDRVPQPDPEKASEIEVIFKDEDGKTRVTFVHKYFERHGKGAGDYLKGMKSPQGWPYILERYKEKVCGM